MTTEKGFNRLSASRLRMILSASLVVISIIIGIGFYFMQSYLYTFAVDVSHKTEDASTSANDIATWQRLKQQLESDEPTIQRTASIVADSKSYEYQDQIIKDLNTYASRSGVSINSFTFSSPNAPGATAGAAAGSSAVPTIAGLKSTTVSITLAAPTKYKDLMEFVHSIEQNLTKMQLGNIVLSKGRAADEVSINTLDIEVYIK